MEQAGFISKTFVVEVYSFSSKDDFNINIEDLNWSQLPNFIKRLLSPYIGFLYSLKNFDIFHFSFSGWLLRSTPLQYIEHLFFKISRKKLIVLIHGGDVYRYSTITDFRLKQALISSYPQMGRIEPKIEKNVMYWSRYADIVITGATAMDGVPRWDTLPVNHVAIDCEQWKPRKTYSQNDGINGKVYIGHSPNRRDVKGTEFIVDAVEKLKKLHKLDVELILIEGKKNSEVKNILEEKIDIMAEQVLMQGYGLSGIEAMACGLPTISNLENSNYFQIFRSHSFLNYCPIYSSDPFKIFEALKFLTENPIVRERLGKASRKYVENFHSTKSSQYMFSNIYSKIWDKKEVDLINLFHPLKSKYMKEVERVFQEN